MKLPDGVDAGVRYCTVFATRYGRNWLRPYTDELNGIIRGVCEDAGMESVISEVQSNGVIIHFEAAPHIPPQRFIRHVQRSLTRHLFTTHPELKSKTSSLWDPDYFIRTIGTPDEKGAMAFINSRPKESEYLEGLRNSE